MNNMTSQSMSLSITTFNMVLKQYLTGIILITGTVANCLVLVIMRTPAFHKLPLSVYFSALAVSDTIVLLLVGIRQIIQSTTGVNIYRVSIFCLFSGFFLPAASMTSSWFVVCVAVERFLVVKYPLKAKKISTKRNAVLAVIGVSSVSALQNSPAIWMVDYGKPRCGLLKQFAWYDTLAVRPYIFLSTYNVVPLMIICTCYIMVVWILKKKQQQVLPHSGATVQKLTTTAIMICLFFMILTMPTTVSHIIRHTPNYKPTTENLMFHEVAQIFRQLNYGTNFFIYFCCNTQFKRATKKIFRFGTDVNSESGGSS